MPVSNAQPSLDLEPATGPAIIVLGRDDAAKAHASYFTADQILSARAAAAAMGMMVLPITTDEQRTLASRLPAGKIFGSGKAFVPFVKAELYDQLIAQVPLADQVRRSLRVVRADANGDDSGKAAETANPAPALGSPHDASKLTIPQDWSKVGPGCVVLAVSDDKAEGWVESVIVQAKGTTYTLRWREYPEQPHFDRTPTGIALMHPSRRATD